MAITQELIEDIKRQLQGLSPEEQQKKLQEIMEKLPPEDREALMGGQQAGGSCPFCSMVEGKIDVKKVYEDEKVLAILDINPATKGHVLLFPKEHVQYMGQLDEQSVAHIFKVVAKLGEIIFQIVNAGGFNIIVQNGSSAGQKSPHFLINIIPRTEGDGVSIAWNPKEAKLEELDELAKKIKEKSSAIKIKKESIVIQKPEEKKEKSDFRDTIRIP